MLDAQGLFGVDWRPIGPERPRRIGFADAREGGRWGLTEQVKIPEGTHAVDRMLSLLSPLGIPAQTDLRLFFGYCPPRSQVVAGSQSIDSGRIPRRGPHHPGAAKRWPLERWWRWDKPLVVPAWWLVLQPIVRALLPWQTPWGLRAIWPRGIFLSGEPWGWCRGPRVGRFGFCTASYGIRLRRGGLGVVGPPIRP